MLVRQHYCPHPVHHKDEPELNFNSGSVPFTSLTEYKKEFIKKPSEPFQNRVVKAEEGPIHDRHSRIQVCSLLCSFSSMKSRFSPWFHSLYLAY